MQVAFTDASGGYYQTEVESAGDVPTWAAGMTPCPVIDRETDPKDAIRAQIVSLEREQLMPRATREFMLLFMESQATTEILAVNPGYQAVKAFDEQIKTLRAKL